MAKFGKPIRQQELAEVRQRWCPGGEGPRQAEKPGQVSSQVAASLFRFERLREIVGNDVALERELLRDFLDDSTLRLAELRSALLEMSPTRVAAQAHGLMGACRTLGADSLAVFCQELEQAADQSTLEPVIDFLAALQRESDQLRATIGTYLKAVGDPLASPTGNSRHLSP